MKRSTAITIGAVGLLAGINYWPQSPRPAYCDDINRTEEQNRTCQTYRRSSSSGSSWSNRSTGWSSYSGSSGSSSSVTSRGGFGSSGFHFSSGG